MFILDATTKSLSLVLGESASTQPVFVVTYGDLGDESLLEGSAEGAANSTTPVTLLAAPGADTRRVVRNITLYNADSIEHTLTLAYVTSGTARTVWEIALAAGATWDMLRAVSAGVGVTDHGALTGLTDDDHPQYHNDARGDLRYAPISVTAYTDEMAQDAVGGMLADTDTVDLTYTDGTPALTADVKKQMSITSDASGLKLAGDAATPGNTKYYGTDGGGTKGFHALPAGATDEKAKVSSNDTTAGYLNGKLVTGTGITLTENTDGGNETLTIASSITQYTDEMAQDAIGAMLADTDTVDVTYTDGTPELKADVKKQMSLTSDGSGLKLDGDAASPGNSKYYGTNSSGTKGFHDVPAASGKPDALYEYPAGAAYIGPAGSAPLEQVTLTNGYLWAWALDDTTAEPFYGQLKLPSDLNAAGTVTFEVDGRAKTAAASKNARFTFGHSAKTDAEAIDAALATSVSLDKALDATQGYLDQLTWTATVADLGWAASDTVRWSLERTAAATNNLTGDYYLMLFRIRVPRA